MRTDLATLTLEEALRGLRDKEFSSAELTRACLDRIRAYNPVINAYISVYESEAMAQAQVCDTRIAAGDRLPLLGIPVSLKDNWSARGMKTAAASKVLDTYAAPYDATATKRLRDAGAVIVGKNNMDAWGHGSSGEHSDYGNTHNPWDVTRGPGGSSSGSGAAVASDMIYMATGTDTGGSIRQPAAYCNVVGLKPTYGRVSRYGIIMMGSSFDSIGHLTKTVWDNAHVLSITAGHDPRDATSSRAPVPAYADALSSASVRGMRIGVPQEYFVDEVDDQVKQLAREALAALEKAGAVLVPLSLSLTKYTYAVYAVLQTSEVSSNLSRYDGIRYGLSRSVMGDEGKRRIMMGTHSLSSGYAGRYYRHALRARRLIIDEFKKAYETVDVIACPVWPFPPFKLGERSIDPLKMYLSDVFTAPANVSGNPSLSVPMGFTKENLPVGIQFMAPNFGEEAMYRVGYAYERETQWYKRKPQLNAIT